MAFIHIGGKTYELIHENRNGWNLDAFRNRYSEVLERYDYIVGDWGYNQLRLKGFFKDQNQKATKDSAFSYATDYINEYCNFGCAFFILEKKSSENEQEDTESTDLLDEEEELDSITTSAQPQNVDVNQGAQGKNVTIKNNFEPRKKPQPSGAGDIDKYFEKQAEKQKQRQRNQDSSRGNAKSNSKQRDPNWDNKAESKSDNHKTKRHFPKKNHNHRGSDKQKKPNISQNEASVAVKDQE